MKRIILDTNILVTLSNLNTFPKECHFLITPWVKREFLSQNDIREQREVFLRKNSVDEIDIRKEYNFFYHFKKTLNEYPDVSFYNMTGFGDVEIIAYIQSQFKETQLRKTQQTKLFGIQSELILVSGDKLLVRYCEELKKENSIDNHIQLQVVHFKNENDILKILEGVC